MAEHPPASPERAPKQESSPAAPLSPESQVPVSPELSPDDAEKAAALKAAAQKKAEARASTKAAVPQGGAAASSSHGSHGNHGGFLQSKWAYPLWIIGYLFKLGGKGLAHAFGEAGKGGGGGGGSHGGGGGHGGGHH